MSEQDTPKLHIDSDWKAQARAEKERLAKKAAEAPAAAGKPAGGAAAATSGGGGGGGAAAGGQMPPANFEGLVSTLATQALFAMGGIPDPRTGQRVAHLPLARHHIDLLTVLEEKTRNNLTEEEATMVSQTLYELRSRYIQLATQARNQGKM